MKEEIIRPYIDLIGDFLCEKIDGRTFQKHYLEMFKKEKNHLGVRTFKTLDRIFADVDCYQPDAKLLKELRQENPTGNYFDERELRNLVDSNLKELLVSLEEKTWWHFASLKLIWRRAMKFWFGTATFGSFRRMESGNSDTRKNLRKNLAEILFDISDLERTKLEWTGKVPGVMRLYIEDVEGFFTDVLAGMSLDENVDAGILDAEEAVALQPFYDAFDKYFESTKHLKRSDVEIAQDPKWKCISELAAATYQKIGARLRS